MITINDFHTDRYTTKEELMSSYGLNERNVRRAVEELRNEGYVILSDSGHKGYKLPSTFSEVERYIGDINSRIIALNKIKKGAMKLYKNKDQFGLGLV